MLLVGNDSNVGCWSLEFLVPSNGCPEQEPYTPEGRVITGLSESDHNRTPPSALAALVISPGSLPAKRLYSDAWNEPPLAEQEAQWSSKNRLSFSGFVFITLFQLNHHDQCKMEGCILILRRMRISTSSILPTLLAFEVLFLP